MFMELTIYSYLLTKREYLAPYFKSLTLIALLPESI
jgi:hypothetical protein